MKIATFLQWIDFLPENLYFTYVYTNFQLFKWNNYLVISIWAEETDILD